MTTSATADTTADTDTSPDTDGLVEQLSESLIGALDVLAVALGDRLGLYEPLADHWHTAGSLAASANIDQRYAREWLEHQTVAGILEVEDAGLAPDQRRFRLPPEHVDVLADPDSLAYLRPFARVIGAAAARLPDLEAAYRSGGGVSWADYGPWMRSGQADANRPLFLQKLGSSWLPSMPGVHDALTAGGRVADVGCGEGWSSIAIALAYRGARVDGYDVDSASVEVARAHAEAYGVSDRVSFHVVDAAEAPAAGGYDLVTAFECVHDLPHPVQVLRAMRRLAAPGAPVVVMDEAVGEEFTGRGDFTERLMYGMSLMVCLPDGRSHTPSAATGTVMRPETLNRYAREAGFTGVEVLPIEHDLFRFYSLLR